MIERDGKLLACQRRRGGAFELLWEFPGGKVKPHESLEAALARELREELNVSAEVGAEVYRARHHYPEMPEAVEVVFFTAKVAAQKIENRVFERLEWRAPETLGELEFLAADRGLIERLVSGTLNGKVSPSHTRSRIPPK
ncbi:MAG: (deoxy)nucleoside triphosphate pyrophosphohydrolase [Candidatus Acidiferrales bacterium]